MCKYLKLHGPVQLGKVAAEAVERGETKNNEGVEEKHMGFICRRLSCLGGQEIKRANEEIVKNDVVIVLSH